MRVTVARELLVWNDDGSEQKWTHHDREQRRELKMSGERTIERWSSVKSKIAENGRMIVKDTKKNGEGV
jgi:hypothetical protein